MERISLTKNVNLNIQSIDKFKDVTLELRFLNKLSGESATKRAVLALIMQDRSTLYQTKALMNKAIDDLYGASLSIRGYGYGQAEVLRLSLKTINEVYVNESLLEKQFAFAHELIFNPLFNEKVFKEAKSALHNELLRLQDDPREYATKLALEAAGNDQALAISAAGNIDDLKSLKLADVIAEYQSILANDLISINVIGGVDKEKIIELCEKYLNFCARNGEYSSYYAIKTELDRHQEISKTIEQSNLIMVYNTNIMITDELYWPLKLGTIILGQLPISLLFIEVREKRSLCYYISANLLSFDGAMLISTGADYENIAQITSVTLEQIHRVTLHDYPLELFEAAKKMIINSLNSTKDSVSSILNFDYQNQLLNKEDTTLSIEHLIQKITIEEISMAFSKIEANMTFVLKKKGITNAENI